MKSIVRSIVSSTSVLISLLLYAYFALIKKAIDIGGIKYLLTGYTEYGRSVLLLNIILCIIFVPLFANFYNKTVLPLLEISIMKGVVKQDLNCTFCSTTHSLAYVPWHTITVIRLPNEKGVFDLPYEIDSNICESKVRITYLKKSRLILEIKSLE